MDLAWTCLIPDRTVFKTWHSFIPKWVAQTEVNLCKHIPEIKTTFYGVVLQVLLSCGEKWPRVSSFTGKVLMNTTAWLGRRTWNGAGAAIRGDPNWKMGRGPEAIFLGTTNTTICPFLAILHYFEVHKSPWRSGFVLLCVMHRHTTEGEVPHPEGSGAPQGHSLVVLPKLYFLKRSVINSQYFLYWGMFKSPVIIQNEGVVKKHEYNSKLETLHKQQSMNIIKVWRHQYMEYEYEIIYLMHLGSHLAVKCEYH